MGLQWVSRPWPSGLPRPAHCSSLGEARAQHRCADAAEALAAGPSSCCGCDHHEGPHCTVAVLSATSPVASPALPLQLLWEAPLHSRHQGPCCPLCCLLLRQVTSPQGWGWLPGPCWGSTSYQKVPPGPLGVVGQWTGPETRSGQWISPTSPGEPSGEVCCPSRALGANTADLA